MDQIFGIEVKKILECHGQVCRTGSKVKVTRAKNRLCAFQWHEFCSKGHIGL